MTITGTLAKSLLDAAPDPTVIVDRSGTIVFANTAVETVFGYPPEDLLEQTIDVLLPERYRARHPAHLTRYFADPRTRPMGAGLELYGRHRDGREFPVEISLSPVETDSGLLVSSAIRDISDRKSIECALIDARNEAERANRAKSAFLAAASHDLRQPLQTLTLLNTALGQISVPGSRAADIAASEAKALTTMSELLNSLLDISKLEAGTITPDIEDCSVKEIFARLHAQFAPQAQAKGLRLEMDECDDVVRTDPTLLEQIVQNLVANAIRYTREGLIQLRCLHEGDHVRIAVADTGIGIPEQEQELIFEEFYQAPRKSGQRKEGLGLGLSIVRRIVDLLELNLEVKSRPGEGSHFTLSVPRGHVADGARAAEPERPASFRAAGATVLIVDDDDSVAEATRLLLEIVGYQPLTAASLAEAEQRLAGMRQAPDLIISDFHLAEGASGVEAILQLRRGLGRIIPAVLVTGDTSAAMAEMAGEIERCHLLSKPVNGEELFELLNRLSPVTG